MYSLFLLLVASSATGADSRVTTTEGAYGRLETNAPSYRPLDVVTVRIQGRTKAGEKCSIRVTDPDRRVYFEAEAVLKNNRAEVRFPAAGGLGAHYIYLTWPGQKRYSRYLNFRVDAETSIESGDRDFDALYPFSRDAMQLGRREYRTPRGKFVGYISADTMHFDGIWLRDWIYGLPGYKHWERDMQCGIDRFLEVQKPDGQVPDGIERNGDTWRVGLESDVEYIMTLGVWQTWRATGDDQWMARALPRLEKALEYITHDPKHWDAKNRLIKRQHSCDTWDYDIDGAKDAGTSRHVIATCDQSGYALAYRAMSDMYRKLGKTSDADRWAIEAEEYRARANKLLWDGTKFLHHVHLDTSISHGDFDESTQLAMGNTWAMTRGFATPDQSMKIIDEYRRRQKSTGDAYPWWSLQPGYPDRLGYWKDPYRLQGAYANGGLMPWVGGELCRAAFLFGREEYGVQLMRQYADHLRRTGGAQVWYYPDGTPGMRTTNEVRYAGWGMAQWVDALMEGMAGLSDAQGTTVSPRWAMSKSADVRVVNRYAAASDYFAYRMKIDRAAKTISISHTGSNPSPLFRVLLPQGWKAKSLRINEAEAEVRTETVGTSNYAVFRAGGKLLGASVLRCE